MNTPITPKFSIEKKKNSIRNDDSTPGLKHVSRHEIHHLSDRKEKLGLERGTFIETSCIPLPSSAMDLNVTQTGTQPYAGRQHLSITPGGTKYWIPDCDKSLKPRKGQKFQSIDAVIDFYKEYACVVRFDVRHSTLIKAKDKTTIWRYLVCSREGYKHHSQPNHSIQTEGSVIRRRVSNRVGCISRIALRVDGTSGC
ncbi:FAR1-related protein [Striga asiatica]|uniref:FAR1-related protein n=1 Tax=Striga asiatica TaxID=4170 RepID=A0A5A7PU72_STRAF|nr:FAR1-related protein [Striga asiatica]